MLWVTQPNYLYAVCCRVICLITKYLPDGWSNDTKGDINGDRLKNTPVSCAHRWGDGGALLFHGPCTERVTIAQMVSKK